MPLLKIHKIHKGQIGIWKIDEKEINSNQLKPTLKKLYGEFVKQRTRNKS